VLECAFEIRDLKSSELGGVRSLAKSQHEVPVGVKERVSFREALGTQL
jgi:hypothetical protein